MPPLSFSKSVGLGGGSAGGAAGSVLERALVPSGALDDPGGPSVRRLRGAPDVGLLPRETGPLDARRTPELAVSPFTISAVGKVPRGVCDGIGPAGSDC